MNGRGIHNRGIFSRAAAPSPNLARVQSPGKITRYDWPTASKQAVDSYIDSLERKFDRERGYSRFQVKRAPATPTTDSASFFRILFIWTAILLVTSVCLLRIIWAGFN